MDGILLLESGRDGRGIDWVQPRERQARQVSFFPIQGLVGSLGRVEKKENQETSRGRGKEGGWTRADTSTLG